MKFELSDEQLSLKSAVRRLLSDHLPLSKRSSVVEDGIERWEELWKAVVEQGWLSLLIPEELGGLQLTLVDAAIIAREIGALLVPGPIMSTIIASDAIGMFGSIRQRKEWLPLISEGGVPVALAIHSANGVSNSFAPGYVARNNKISGTGQGIEFATDSHVILIAARSGSGTELYLVDSGTGGVSIEDTPALDRTVQLSSVTLEDVEGDRLERGDDSAYKTLVSRSTALCANELTGLAREALQLTIEYAKERTAFGHPIGSFQAIKHALATSHIELTMAEHLCLMAAYAADALPQHASVTASMAKAKSGIAARHAIDNLLQYHGAIAFTWEHHAHLYLKRAARLEFKFGDTASHWDNVASYLIDGDRASSSLPLGD